MTDPAPAVRVTLIDVYREQIRMSGQLSVLVEQMKAIPDHEARLRALERWRYALPASLLLTAGGWALVILEVLSHSFRP